MRLDLSSLIDADVLPLVEETRAFYAQRRAGRGPATLDELRAVRASAPPPQRVEPSPRPESINAAGRDVPVRIHTPAGDASKGVLLELHGGGFYLGSAAAGDLGNRRLADTLGIAVVSVDYRLAPEHPWPAAPDDCETAALWLAEQAERQFGTARIAVAGFSAGATLAVTTLLRLQARGVTAFSGAVLQFGTYDLSAQTPAGRLIADEFFIEAYAAAATDRTAPDLSPVFADLAGLPPVLMVVGRDDILLEDNLAMAGRFASAGVEVDLRIYPASPHGFTGHPTRMARAALDGIDAWLRACLDLGP